MVKMKEWRRVVRHFFSVVDLVVHLSVSVVEFGHLHNLQKT